MQIVPFLPHYQLVYINFDFSSFSLISYAAKSRWLQCQIASVGIQERLFGKVPQLQLLIDRLQRKNRTLSILRTKRTALFGKMLTEQALIQLDNDLIREYRCVFGRLPVDLSADPTSENNQCATPYFSLWHGNDKTTTNK